MKRQFRDISGILLLDKPQGLSSNQALQKVRWMFNARKAGHTGSLDPMATGLLPICLGEATKIAGHLLGSRKAYLAELRLGVTTNTDDAEGQVTQTRPVPPLDDAAIGAELVPLRGRIVQIPPVYSALKQGGVALYKRARRGEDVQAPPREVEVYRLELTGREGDLLRLNVECGSGTYVRSLARDLGERLGCGAHLTALRRTWVEPFVEPQMTTLDALLQMQVDGDFSSLDRLLLPLEEGLAALPALHLDPVQTQMLRHGQRLIMPQAAESPLGRALDGDGHLIALVQVRADGEIAVRRGFNMPLSHPNRLQ